MHFQRPRYQCTHMFFVQNGTFWQQVCRTEVWKWRGLKVITPQCTSWSPAPASRYRQSSRCNPPPAHRPASQWLHISRHHWPSNNTHRSVHSDTSNWKRVKSTQNVFLQTDQQIIMLVPNPWLPSSSKPLNSDAISLICLCHNHTPWVHQYPGSTQLWHCPSGSEGFLWMNVYQKVNLLIPIKC